MPKKIIKWVGIVVGFFAILFIIALVSVMKEYPAPTPTPTQSTSTTSPVSQTQAPEKPELPRLEIKLTESEYEYGFLKLVGTVKNNGTGPAFSPTVRVKIYKDEAKTVLLAEDVAYPAGTYLDKLEPGAEVAFETMTHVPGEPKHVYYTYGVD